MATKHLNHRLLPFLLLSLQMLDHRLTLHLSRDLLHSNILEAENEIIKLVLVDTLAIDPLSICKDVNH